MKNNEAKMKTLESIIDMMDTRMLGKAKKKGQPEPEAETMVAMITPEESNEDNHEDREHSDISPEMLEQLKKMYEDETGKAVEPQ